MTRYKTEKWFKLLGNQYRRKILRLLVEKPRYQKELAKILGITPHAVYKHLDYLANENIIGFKETNRPKGGRKFKYCYLKRNFGFSGFFDLRNNFVDVDIHGEEYQSEAADLAKDEDEFIDVGIVEEEGTHASTLSDSQRQELEFLLQDLQATQDKINAYRKSLQTESKKYKILSKNVTRYFLNHQQSPKIAYLYKQLLFRYGTQGLWSRQAVMEILNTDYESATQIIHKMEIDLQIIIFKYVTEDTKVPLWSLKSLLSENSKASPEYF